MSDFCEGAFNVATGVGALGCGCFSMLVQIGAAVIGLCFVLALFNSCTG